jgi:hypothetical protein
MIYNIEPGTFGGPARNGDIVAIINVIQHLRFAKPNLKFHMKPGTISADDYCQKFFQYLCKTNDFFSPTQGTESLNWRKVNLWDFRDIIGDNVSIKNPDTMVDKIVIFPVTDAPYNTYRNWSSDVLPKVIGEFSRVEYMNYEKLICVKEPLKEKYDGWTYSTDMVENIHHINTAKVYVGGDTGTSHYTWSLDRGPETMIYYNSSRGLIHTLPFYITKGKGELRTYWLDFEGTKW